ncbi:hypothetical protein HOC13_02385 [Candidatus Woesearchaeota archaeon]|nr:hypothetical protein [Candidatus Woesearchaeota archaeon]
MKKKVFKVILLVIVLILIASCGFKPSTGETPQETSVILKQVQTGTQGIVANFVPNYPPPDMYDITELLVLAEIKNKGNYDLEPGACHIHLTGYADQIIKGMPTYLPCGMIEGKDIHNLEGGFNQLEFRSSNIKLPPKLFDYHAPLNLLACYKYQTVANPQVCVENNLYQIASEQKACIVKDVSGGGGQGAPLGVSYVRPQMAGSKAIFEISIQNFGTGKVLSPTIGTHQCAKDLTYKDYDLVAYSVKLSGVNNLLCKPQGFLRLYNGQGKIICSAIVPNTPAYETPITITLDYNYMESILKTIQIIKTPE